VAAIWEASIPLLAGFQPPGTSRAAEVVTMGAVNSRFVAHQHPNKDRAAEELVRSLASLIKVIDENPSIEDLFKAADLAAARRAISDYQWVQRFETNKG
jgi:hypothetical protein